MNKKYDEFAYCMGYITADEFYKIYDKFAKYLPDNIDYSNYDDSWQSLDEFFLELYIYKITNNTDICVYYYDDVTYEIEECNSIKEINQIQELLDNLGLNCKESSKKLALAYAED